MRAFPCRLFETHPEVKPLFSFFKEDSEVSGDNAGMRKHGLTVMETVNVAVEHIRNSTLGELAGDLFDLGVVHHTLQVNIAEQHFAVSVRSIVPAPVPHMQYSIHTCSTESELIYSSVSVISFLLSAGVVAFFY